MPSRIVDKAESRSEVEVLRGSCRFTWKARVARECQTRRCVDEGLTDLSGIESSQVELRSITILGLLRDEWIPANAGINLKPRRQLPVVLEVERRKILVFAANLTAAL